MKLSLKYPSNFLNFSTSQPLNFITATKILAQNFSEFFCLKIKNSYICTAKVKVIWIFCGSSSVVEHNLAKVGAAGSNPVSRSERSPGGGTGRRVGLKIQWPLHGCAGSSPALGTSSLPEEFCCEIYNN